MATETKKTQLTRGPKRIIELPQRYRKYEGADQITTVAQLAKLDEYLSMPKGSRPSYMRIGASTFLKPQIAIAPVLERLRPAFAEYVREGVDPSSMSLPEIQDTCVKIVQDAPCSQHGRDAASVIKKIGSHKPPSSIWVVQVKGKVSVIKIDNTDQRAALRWMSNEGRPWNIEGALAKRRSKASGRS
jgi:hypothetical protein